MLTITYLRSLASYLIAINFLLIALIVLYILYIALPSLIGGTYILRAFYLLLPRLRLEGDLGYYGRVY